MTKITIKAAPVPATSISLNFTELTLKEEETAVLTATVDPENTTDTVVWTSSNEEIVEVDEDGNVTAKAIGTATITAKAGEVSATCAVTVECAHKNVEEKAAVAATCTAKGNDAYKECECGQLFNEAGEEIDEIPVTEINPDNHVNTEDFEEKSGNCTTPGHGAYTFCNDCENVVVGSDAPVYGDHTYGDLVPAQEEIHTQTELKASVAAHYQCSVCEKYFDESKNDTTLDELTGDTPEHTYGDLEALDATHHGYICSVATCGLIKDQAEHKYDNDADMGCNDCGYDRSCKHPEDKRTVYEAVESTCKTQGHAEYVFCEECETVIEGSDAALPLNPDKHEVLDLQNKVDSKYLMTAANCENDAVYYKSYECCGAASDTETFVDADTKLGHSFTELQYDETDHWMKCERCTVIEPKEAHTGGTATCIAKAVCEVCEKEYGDFADHSFSGEYSSDADTHWHECTVEGCTVKTEAEDHVYDDDADMICNICEYDRSCKHEAEKRTYTAAAEPTCTDNGMKEYWLCECGVKLDAEEDGNVVTDEDLGIPALGHDMADATCTEPSTCKRGCGYTEGDALGHDMADATCTEPSTCMRGCGYTEGEPLGHTDEDGDEICDVCLESVHEHVYDTEAWESDETGHWNECACGEKANFDKHVKSNWIIDTEATETTEGTRHIECVVCGYVMDTDTIPVLKPSFTNEAWYYQMLYLVNQNFTITAAAGEGGSITDEGVSVVKYNTAKKYVITADEGYVIKSVIVNGKDIGAVPEYNFKSIKSNQTISVIFEKIGWNNPFADIAETDAYYAAVQYVYENGLFKGISETEFAPATTMTRAMFVTVLGRLSGVNEADYPVVSFADCEAGSWYAPFVEWAAQAGIVNGYSAEAFGPMDEITVEQAAVILYRYIAYMGYSTAADAELSNYTDGAQVSDWAVEQMKWALANGIYVSDTTLDPQAPAARSLVAEMLYNLSVWMG